MHTVDDGHVCVSRKCGLGSGGTAAAIVQCKVPFCRNQTLEETPDEAETEEKTAGTEGEEA